MGSKALKARKRWQDKSGAMATAAEQNFFNVFNVAFRATSFQIESKPKGFSNIYTKVVLSRKTLGEIYDPPHEITKHGIMPDYCITNRDTNKKLYIEVKRQDGW